MKRKRIEPAVFVVAFGDCFNGLAFFGPFDDCDVAQDYAEEHRSDDEEYHIVEVEPPAEST